MPTLYVLIGYVVIAIILVAIVFVVDENFTDKNVPQKDDDDYIAPWMCAAMLWPVSIPLGIIIGTIFILFISFVFIIRFIFKTIMKVLGIKKQEVTQ